MRLLTLTELMRLTRTELFALVARMTTALSEFPQGSYEYAAPGRGKRRSGQQDPPCLVLHLSPCPQMIIITQNEKLILLRRKEIEVAGYSA
jgi:hypothetical protein